MEPRVIHADEDIIVLDKPSGLVVHATAPSSAPTLVDWLVRKYPEIAFIGEDPARPGIVHRIDRDTSGILVVARSAQAYARLKKAFQRHEVHKTYRAFVYGAVKEERGIVDRPLGRAPGSGSRRSVRDPHGTLREAQTSFRRLVQGADASYLEVFPKTGRTHQIRVHLAFVHHPVVCDALYAPGRPALLGFTRLALHALALSFVHPGTGRRVSFEAPLPADFRGAEEKLRGAERRDRVFRL